MQAKIELADVLLQLGDGIESVGLNPWQYRTLYALKVCRTAALGGHIDACDSCGTMRISYNSCRNRHCPKCQGHKKEQWIQARESELLPVPYFHVVFTLPDTLNTLAIAHPKIVYDALFAAAWKTLSVFSANKGVKAGMIAILHTWGQNLSLHPHIHCIVPGGGVNTSNLWSNIRKDGKFLFPVKALSVVFRAKYVAELAGKLELDKGLREKLFEKPWIIYAKKPFGSPLAVVEYLGRYTHKIAISNNRLWEVNDQTVTFSYKDYKERGIKKTMTLPNKEFIRRFALHILPKRFVKIRHYGFLSSTWKRVKFKQLKTKLYSNTRITFAPKVNPRPCPCCKKGTLVTIEYFGKRGPPDWWKSGGCQTLTPQQ